MKCVECFKHLKEGVICDYCQELISNLPDYFDLGDEDGEG